jgi:hypothetical protein
MFPHWKTRTKQGIERKKRRRVLEKQGEQGRYQLEGCFKEEANRV